MADGDDRLARPDTAPASTPGPGSEHAPVAPRRPLRRRTQLLIVALVGAAVLAAVLYVGLIGHDTPSLEPPAAAPAGTFKPTQAQWDGLKLQPAALATFQAARDTDGKIAIDDDLTTPVFSPFSGRVTRLFARAGDIVKVDDPLFAIQASEFAQGQNDLISAAASLKTARAQLALAITNEKRQHELYTSGGAALKDWQQSQVDLATAQGAQRSAEIAANAVRNRLRILGKSDDEIAALENAANLQQIGADTIVRAPIAGTITQRQIGLGQNIVSASSGATAAVFLIGDLSRLWLLANAREIDAPSIHLGDALEVRVLAFPGRVFHARVSYVGASIDPTTHRLPVRADVENPDGALKPEMFATFRIVTGQGSQAVAVPERAVVYDADTTRVFVADPANRTLAVRSVKLGRVQDGQAEILEGLRPGDTVVTAGAVFIDRAVEGN